MSAEIWDVDFVNRVSRKRKTMAQSQPLSKAEVFERMIQLGKTSVYVDATRPEVLLPEHLKSTNAVVIDWSLKFGLQDFAFDQRGVRGTLSFNREPFYVDLPWSAVWQLENPAHKPARVPWLKDAAHLLRTYENRIREVPKPTEVENGKQRMAVKDSSGLAHVGPIERFFFRVGQKIAAVLRV